MIRGTQADRVIELVEHDQPFKILTRVHRPIKVGRQLMRFARKLKPVEQDVVYHRPGGLFPVEHREVTNPGPALVMRQDGIRRPITIRAPEDIQLALGITALTLGNHGPTLTRHG